MSIYPKNDLGRSTVWAAVVVIVALLVFFGFLINAGRTDELRSMLILLGQGAIGIVNLWVVYKSGKVIGHKADENRQATREVKTQVAAVQTVVEDVKTTVDGNTPPRGFQAVDEYQPEH